VVGIQCTESYMMEVVRKVLCSFFINPHGTIDAWIILFSGVFLQFKWQNNRRHLAKYLGLISSSIVGSLRRETLNHPLSLQLWRGTIFHIFCYNFEILQRNAYSRPTLNLILLTSLILSQMTLCKINQILSSKQSLHYNHKSQLRKDSLSIERRKHFSYHHPRNNLLLLRTDFSHAFKAYKSTKWTMHKCRKDSSHISWTIIILLAVIIIKAFPKKIHTIKRVKAEVILENYFKKGNNKDKWDKWVPISLGGWTDRAFIFLIKNKSYCLPPPH
jgi:hypothetical protein